MTIDEVDEIQRLADYLIAQGLIKSRGERVIDQEIALTERGHAVLEVMVFLNPTWDTLALIAAKGGEPVVPPTEDEPPHPRWYDDEETDPGNPI